MDRNEILKRIAQKALRDRRYRRDPRYLQIFGFLVKKGFLKTNEPTPPRPYKNIPLKDAIWAGRKVEPRILEVLPATVLRFPQYFDLHANTCKELTAAVERLKHNQQGEAVFGIPYEQYAKWVNLPLRDKRTKNIEERKVTKTFRLSPKAIATLRKRSQDTGCTETELLERLLRQE